MAWWILSQDKMVAMKAMINGCLMEEHPWAGGSRENYCSPKPYKSSTYLMGA